MNIVRVLLATHERFHEIMCLEGKFIMVRHVAVSGYVLALCCILTGPAVSPAIAAIVPAVPAGYKLNWSDEFNGTALDLNKWQVQQGGDSYSVGNGVLTMTVWTGSDGVTHFGSINNYRHSWQQTYGYFVASIKFGTTQPGSYSAFYTYSTDMGATGNPALDGTEVDIFEHYPQYTGKTDVPNKAMISEWWRAPPSAHVVGGSSLWTPSIGLDDGNFHLFALQWTPTAYKVYIDNTLYRTMTDAVSQHFLYAILENSCEGSPGPFGYLPGGYGLFGSSQNVVMNVDYLRIYSIPEPSSFVLLGIIAISLFGWAARSRRKRAIP
jgi:hypothetical protein